MSIDCRLALVALLMIGALEPTFGQPTQSSQAVSPARATAATAASASAPSTRPASSGVATSYHSAFEGYRSFTDEPVGNWKAANDKVGQIGGWRVYAKEASSEGDAHAGHKATAAAPSSGPASVPASRPAAAGASAPSLPSANHKNH